MEISFHLSRFNFQKWLIPTFLKAIEDITTWKICKNGYIYNEFLEVINIKWKLAGS